MYFNQIEISFRARIGFGGRETWFQHSTLCRWKKLDEETRKPFVDEADRLRNLHQQEYPDYK